MEANILLSHPEERDLYDQIEMLYSIDPSLDSIHAEEYAQRQP
jgi:hypothetical protein